MKLDDTSSSRREGFLCLSPGRFSAHSLQGTFPPKVAASLLEILLIFFLSAVKYAADRRWQVPYHEQGKSRGLTPALTYSSKISLLVSQNNKWIRRENWLIIPSPASGQSSYLLFVVRHTKHILPRQIGGQGPCPEEHTIYGADPVTCSGPSREEQGNFISGWFWHILGGLTSLANTNCSSDPWRRGWLL